MAEKFRGAYFDRESLPAALTQLRRQKLESVDWEAFVQNQPPERGGAVGSWSSTLGDPFAEVLIVRDNDFVDTVSWLNAFFAPLSPISQWCRILRVSQASQIARRSHTVGLNRMLGAWIGAVLAECSVQAGGIQNLKEVLGSAAASCATFAGGRASSVWGDDADLVEIASRHDELTSLLRDGIRPIKASSLVPLWSVLNGYVETKSYSDQKSLGPFVDIFADITAQVDRLETAELIARISMQAGNVFNLLELTSCAQGPQVERVRALDKLGQRLSDGPQSPAIDALLGLGASFVDPGAAISSELLRRYERQLPLAPIWQGAFAGAFLPFRVMTDQGGLGRLIAKAFLAPDDLQCRPICDISFEELVRRVTPGRSFKLDFRGMSARILSVELMPGITCNFAQSRAEASSTATTRNDAHRPSANSERFKIDNNRSQQDINSVLNSILQRVERLEEREANHQSSLDFQDTKDNTGKRSSRTPSTKGKN